MAEIGRQIAGLVDEIDQILPDHALRRRRYGDRHLLGEVIRQFQLRGDEGFEIIVLVIGGAAAPFGVGGGRGILRGARGGLGRLLGKDVVEAGVERLLDLGAAAEIAVHPLFLAGLEALGAASGKLAAGFLAMAGFPGLGKWGGLHRLARHRRLGAVIGAIEQRIALQLFLDKGRQIEIRQLQQLDGLHQLRGHHQRLRLPEL